MKTIQSIKTKNSIVNNLLDTLTCTTIDLDYLAVYLQLLADIFGDFTVNIEFTNTEVINSSYEQNLPPRKSVCIIANNIINNVVWGKGMDYKDFATAIAQEMGESLYMYPNIHNHLDRYFNLFNDCAPRSLLKSIDMLKLYVNTF